MKVAIFAVCILSAFVINSVVSQFPPFIPPIIPPVGLGLGLPFGPLGLGLGLGPFGLGGGLLFRRPLLRLALLGGMLGKRDVSDVQAMLNATDMNSTICGISSATSKLTCHIVAKNENIDCKVVAKLEKLGNLNLTSIDMDVMPEKIESEDIFRIHSTKEDKKITFVNPIDKKPVLLSIFQSEKIAQPGFMVQDKQCWSRLETLLKESKEKSVRLSLFWSQ